MPERGRVPPNLLGTERFIGTRTVGVLITGWYILDRNSN